MMKTTAKTLLCFLNKKGQGRLPDPFFVAVR
ncbi:hypothetical protein A5814_000874 [Enterococcus faecium]|nr:hypothetical protein A5814_000874 [Enterococcus faecium]